MKVLQVNLGLTQFNEVWKIQKNLHQYKQKNKSEDIIITTQHFPVYTLGKSGDRNHLLLSEEKLNLNKISYYEIDRGGDITYHGPGQLVLYPIFDLNNYYKDIHRFLRDLEEAVIMTLEYFGIKGHREEEFTGVWVGGEKICAIGIKVSRWITMHGLALNINNDLSYFDKIIPCGIFHKGVTSFKKILGKEADFNKVSQLLVNNMEKVFNIDVIEFSEQELTDRITVPAST
ncbi:MAG TPA: lipoyl(octanoyl) transferase LipB [Ignavibacteria bacterium]|jgi:lipoyl(octanoyl) transferase